MEFAKQNTVVEPAEELRTSLFVQVLHGKRNCPELPTQEVLGPVEWFGHRTPLTGVR